MAKLRLHNGHAIIRYHGATGGIVVSREQLCVLKDAIDAYQAGDVLPDGTMIDIDLDDPPPQWEPVELKQGDIV